MIEFVKTYRAYLAATFISIMYTVGLVQLLYFGRTEIMNLTPLQLILSLIVVLIFILENNKLTNTLALIVIYGLGFSIEIIGVQTAFPFGEYSYGDILGPKIAGTPLLIGVNWLLVIVGASALAERLFPKSPKYLRILIAATLALLLDLLIEPVAVQLGMWSWTEGHIPYSNYLAWWILATIFTSIYQKWGNNSRHWVVILVFVWLLIFFSSLNLYFS